MKIINCSYQEHAPEILDIFNEAIANSTALYAYKARTMEFMDDWFKAKEAARFPVIGAIDDSGRLMGFASYGQFRPWPAYKYTVEHSVYVHVDFRGKGVGKALMMELLARAVSQQYHVIIGAVDAANQASISLHQGLGFSHSGTIRHAGYKFGQWQDLAFYQLLLEPPANPIEE